MSSSRQALTAMVPLFSDKIRSSDSDIRIMALLDFNKELVKLAALPTPPPKPSARSVPDNSYIDEASEKHLTTLVLSLLDDTNAEVKNTAVTSLANMSKKARPAYLRQIVLAVTDGIGGPGQNVDEERKDISCLALRSIVATMPIDSANTAANLQIILERIRVNVTNPNTNPYLTSDLLQTASDVYDRFAEIVVANTDIQNLSVQMFHDVFLIPRLSVCKRAVPALASFIALCPQRFDFVKTDMEAGFAGGLTTAQPWVAAVAGLAKTSAVSEIAALITEGTLVDNILAQTQDPEEYDAVEGALWTLEVLVLRCPTAISQYVPKLAETAVQLVKYDPNYVDFGDDDVDMGDDDLEDDEDDEFDAGGYSDDDDDSWKVRRSAAKLLSALIGTRIDLLQDFYKTVAPVLVSRFSEREESVRLEVLSAFEALLQQTAAARDAEISAGGRNKRKRSEDMDEDAPPEESAVSILHDIRPQLISAVLKQTSAKTPNTRQQSFILLRQIVEALDGGLDNETDAVCTAAKNALRSPDCTIPAFTIAVLTFLAAFFAHHFPRTYASELADLTPSIVKCMRDKIQRVNFEAFATASALARAIRQGASRGAASPLRNGFEQPVLQMFAATSSVLGDSSVDGEVREKALTTLGDLLAYEGDVLLDQLSSALQLITARLSSETTAPAAIVTIGRLADSGLLGGATFEQWLLDILPQVVAALRRNRRSATKASEFVTLENIVCRIGTSLPEDTASGVIAELKPFVSLPAALQVISMVLTNQPAVRPSVDKYIFPEALDLIKTTTNAAVIESLTAFFGTYIDGDVDCSLRMVPMLIANVSKTTISEATVGGTLPLTTTAQVIGTVVEHSERNLAGILQLFQRTLKSSKASDSDIYLSLRVIGEIGRNFDLSTNAGLFQHVLDFMAYQSEEVRNAAAFTLGNMAVGGSDEYLPALVRLIEGSKDEPTRLLLLYALKEVILHSNTGQLEKLTDIVWRPLFGKDSGSSQNEAAGDDGVRNVKAACIGKLTIASPERFLPQLRDMLSGTTQERALVAASIRYTFIDSSSQYNELIAPVVGDFLSLMQDPDVVVRRLAVASLNAAVQNKPHLIMDKLQTLQPYLYKETEIKKELQREVKIATWTVVEDDGLENRKTAYETMYTLLNGCFSKIDLPTFTDRVLAALRDVNEIKVLGLMLLLRLGKMAPAVVVPRLDEVEGSLRIIMKDLEVREDTIKQDLERKAEMQRSALRTAVPLYRMITAPQAPVFHAFVAGLLKLDQWRDYREYHG